MKKKSSIFCWFKVDLLHLFFWVKGISTLEYFWRLLEGHSKLFWLLSDDSHSLQDPGRPIHDWCYGLVSHFYPGPMVLHSGDNHLIGAEALFSRAITSWFNNCSCSWWVWRSKMTAKTMKITSFWQTQTHLTPPLIAECWASRITVNWL